MDSARDVNTQEIVEAESLWLLDVVDQDGDSMRTWTAIPR